MKSCQKEIFLGPGSLLLVREADAGTNSPGWDQGAGKEVSRPCVIGGTLVHLYVVICSVVIWVGHVSSLSVQRHFRCV